jgi:hypothetical protein
MKIELRKGKLIERWGRKAMSLKWKHYDCQVADAYT